MELLLCTPALAGRTTRILVRGEAAPGAAGGSGELDDGRDLDDVLVEESRPWSS
jgi:hypothetical protein